MNVHAEKNHQEKTEAVAQNVSQKQQEEGLVYQLTDNRPEAQKAVQLQAMANSYAAKKASPFSGSTPIQRKRTSKKAGWNDKQKAQNKRLFERREARQAGYARARERERTAILSGMKNAQRLSFEGLSGPIKAGMKTLYNTGFTQQNSSGRAVFNKTGNFDACKTAAQRVIGDLGNNRENGTDLSPTGVVKERYMVNWQGINVIVRNFSSNNAVLGTIEFQTGVVFEFKYL
jgi:hypothetical protein